MAEQHAIFIETLPPLRVACFRAVSLTPEADAVQGLESRLVCERIQAPARRFGFDVEVSVEEQKTGLRSYEAWIPISAEYSPADGIRIKDFLGGDYAVMTLFQPCGNFFARDPQAWKRLHHWVIESECYRSANHQWLEEFITQNERYELKLYHPVRIFR